MPPVLLLEENRPYAGAIFGNLLPGPPLAVINRTTLQGCAGIALDTLDHGMHAIGPLGRQMRRKAQSFE